MATCDLSVIVSFSFAVRLTLFDGFAICFHASLEVKRPSEPHQIFLMVYTHRVRQALDAKHCEALPGKAPRLVAMKVFDESEEVLQYLAGSLKSRT